MTNPTIPALSDAEVLEFLKSNPDFLDRNPEACVYLVPPKEDMGRGVADFQHYMVQRLKKDKEAITETTRDLIEVSRMNMNSVTRIHDASLRVLEARNFAGFIQAITMDIAAILDVDAVALVVESDGTTTPAAMNAAGIRVVPQGTITGWMTDKHAILQNDIHGSEAVFGGAARLVRSQAILRVDISQQTPPAILAFGSRDPEMFREGQGTELVTYLTRVVERTFRLWLELPA